MRSFLPWYRRDWFLALALGLTLGLGGAFKLPPVEYVEGALYDAAAWMNYREGGTGGDISLVLIGEDSESAYGPWPWPRRYLADVVRRLDAEGARAIVLLPALEAVPPDPVLAPLAELETLARESGAAQSLQEGLSRIRWLADDEARLAAAIEAADAVFLGAPAGSSDGGEVPDYVPRLPQVRITPDDYDSAHVLFYAPLEKILRPELRHPAPEAFAWPATPYGERARGTGYAGHYAAADGVTRSYPLMLEIDDQWYPSLALLVAAWMLETGPADVVAAADGVLRVGDHTVATDPAWRFYPGFRRDSREQPAFARYSLSEVMAETISGRFRDQIVFVGPSADLNTPAWASPVAARTTGVEVQANLVASVVNADNYLRPDWARWAELVALALAVVLGVTLVLLLPPAWAIPVALMTGLLLLLGGLYFMLGARTVVALAMPALMVPVVATTTGLRRMYRARREQQLTRLAEADRQLGLSYQGQGQLDLALDHFRALPPQRWALELMYNLARDFERKRQHNKALAAYDHILRHDPRFSDVAERRERMHTVESTLVMGARGRTDADTLLLATVQEDAQPTLGRYTIESHLGRGAMGAVYKGVDPRINRVVAIKTLAIQDEFDADEVAEVRQRFFHEAEIAGRLSHPNIVTIYDAGEDHDLAYIAMEYLEGSDLRELIRDKRRLPSVDKAMQMIAQIAEALDYAHSKGVIHRDIKPSNIMVEKGSGQLKLADFGVARITSSSRTRTGTILGTPPYMSPEQLAGEHVDGRSDIFSLGVVLYELVAGKRPFDGDSMAALTYQITNEKHPPITGTRKQIPRCLSSIIDRALQKNPNKRYQSAGSMHAALLRCVNSSGKNAR